MYICRVKNLRVRIFQIITVSEFGGAQTIVASLSEAMNADHEIFILYGGDGESWQHLKDKVHLIKLNEHRKNISWKDIFLSFKLFYLRIKYRPDIVHLHSSKMGVMGRLIFNPKKIVLTMHGFDSVLKAFRKFLIIEKLLKNRAARIIGVSQYDVDCMRNEGIHRNVELVYNGVIDHYKIDKGLNEMPLISEQLKGITNRYPHTIMCISRISKQKKFDLFLDIAKAKPDYAFVWIGNKTKMENLPSNVYCLGEAYMAYQYLKYADVFILPSNYEGLPISILEALSYQVPVVASSVGGITEVLNGENGFAVDNSVQSFVTKIDFVLQSDVHERMKEKARESYLENFTIDKMTAGYRFVFDDIYNQNTK